jgi:hypothetical protein
MICRAVIDTQTSSRRRAQQLLRQAEQVLLSGQMARSLRESELKSAERNLRAETEASRSLTNDLLKTQNLVQNAARDRTQLSGLNGRLVLILQRSNYIRCSANNLNAQIDIVVYLEVQMFFDPLRVIGETVAGLIGSTNTVGLLPNYTVEQVNDLMRRFQEVIPLATNHRQQFNELMVPPFTQAIAAYNKLLSTVEFELSTGTGNIFLMINETTNNKREAILLFNRFIITASMRAAVLIKQLDELVTDKTAEASSLKSSIASQEAVLRGAVAEVNQAETRFHTANMTVSEREQDVSVRRTDLVIREQELEGTKNICQTPSGSFMRMVCMGVIAQQTTNLQNAQTFLRDAEQALRSIQMARSIAQSALIRAEQNLRVENDELKKLTTALSPTQLSVQTATRDRNQLSRVSSKLVLILLESNATRCGPNKLMMQVVDISVYLNLHMFVSPLRSIGKMMAGLLGSTNAVGLFSNYTVTQIDDLKRRLFRSTTLRLQI